MALAGCYTPKGAFVSVDDYADAAPPGAYVIGPGDLLDVRVFQQEGASARVRVRRDGRVSLPFLSDVAAAGLTPVALAAQIQKGLKEFINNPVVTVSLEEAKPLAVSVLGEVARPGVHTLETGSGVLQALAAAGGFNEFGHRDGIFVVRHRPGVAAPVRIRFSYAALTRLEGKGPGFVLAPGDILVVE